MSEGPPGEHDPFAAEDPAAAERERRRREREERRRARATERRAEGTRRSLAERVRGATAGPADAGAEREGGAGEPAAAGEGRQDAGEERPAATPPRPRRRITGAWERYRPGPTNDRQTIVRRRLLAVGAVLVVLALIVLAVKAIGGGEPAPVAAPKPLKTISVLVPEGMTIDQIAKVAKKAKLKGSYKKAAKKAMKRFPLKRYDAADAPSLEGFLFPATYELEKHAPAKDLVAKQLQAFRQNFDGVDLSYAKKKNLTPYDVLKIASMVEKEVQVPKERRLVAAVIYNRLAAGDTLGIDSTLRYELGDYNHQLLQSELESPTPYNTRLNPGLPPTPISNPGLASIEAAANPARSDVYYFVIKPGTCNEHFFTADAAEFQAAQARYQEALKAKGGSPTDCS